MSLRRTPVVSVSATAALALLAAAGCGPIVLMHDLTIGPISPAGLLASDAFSDHTLRERSTISDPATATRPLPGADGHLIRVLPRSWTPEIRPHFFGRVIRGVAASSSLVTTSERRIGNIVRTEDRRDLIVGQSTRSDVLAALGPPREWRRRPAGDMLVYDLVGGSSFRVNIDLGPAARFAPVPLPSLYFRYNRSATGRDRVMLLFDRQGILRSLGDVRATGLRGL